MPKPILLKTYNPYDSPEERRKREQPVVQGSSLSGGESSPNESPNRRFTRSPMESSFTMSCGPKSQSGFAFTLASKINIALSRVISSNSNANLLLEEDDMGDLMALLDELNSHTDLTVKLSNQSKICKILQSSQNIRILPPSPSTDDPSQPDSPVLGETTSHATSRIKAMLEDCKMELEKLQSEKETAIDNFLESLTEEKFE